MEKESNKKHCNLCLLQNRRMILIDKKERLLNLKCNGVAKSWDSLFDNYDIVLIPQPNNNTLEKVFNLEHIRKIREIYQKGTFISSLSVNVKVPINSGSLVFQWLAEGPDNLLQATGYIILSEIHLPFLLVFHSWRLPTIRLLHQGIPHLF